MRISILILLTAIASRAANLDIQSVSNQVYDGGDYDVLIIYGSTDITVKNCTFKSNSGTVVNIQNSSYVTLENCDVDGLVDACTGVSIGGESHHVTFRGCRIHNIADDGFSVHSVNNIFFYNNTIEHLHGCGTDGGCGPCYNGHSDGIELFSVDTCIIDGNLIYDVTSTGAIFSSHWNTPNSEWIVTNNIFYTPKTGICVYFQHTNGLKIFNNIVWGSLWQGLSLGQGLTGLEVKNNILQNINYTHMSAVYDSAEHDIDYNLLADNDVKYGYTPNSHDIEDSTHRFTVIPEEAADHQAYSNHTERSYFAPLAANRTIDAGFASVGIPNIDMYGNVRHDAGSIANTGAGTYDYYDMGAIEYNPADIRNRPENDPPLKKGMLQVYPNPVRTCGIIRGDGPVTIQAFNGIRVRSINRLPAVWDGTDQEGRKVPNGVYIVDSGYNSTECILLR